MSELVGYVTDMPYVRGFKPMLAPAWLELVATISGFPPPRRASAGLPDALSAAARVSRRVLVRDFLIDQRFRCDVFARDARRLNGDALALAAGGDIRPVEKTRAPVTALNRALWRHFGGSEEIPVLALPCGTALDIDADVLGLMRGDFAGERGAAWREFLTMHGVE